MHFSIRYKSGRYLYLSSTEIFCSSVYKYPEWGSNTTHGDFHRGTVGFTIMRHIIPLLFRTAVNTEIPWGDVGTLGLWLPYLGT